MDTFIVSLVGIIIIFVICTVIKESQKQEEMNKYKNGEMTQEEKEKFETKLKYQQENKERMRKARTISKVMIVGANSDSRKSVSSSVMRGAVGGALLGPVGLVGGALSGKNKVTNETTFLIEYEDGHRETKTVNNDSFEFKNLCKYLKM